VHTDGEHIQINIVDGMRKAKNSARDPRVAVNIADPDNVARYYAVRGRVIGSTTEGAADNIDEISQKYLGIDYPGFGGTSTTRRLLTIAVDSIAHTPQD
jgi:hypothetical protein